MRRCAVVAVAVTVLVGGSCSSHDREPTDPPTDPQHQPQHQPRVIEPPSGTPRQLPPHAIRADGVGPYRLGETLQSILEQLPSGPRIALFDIPGLVHRSLIRAEHDTVLIGGEPTTTASFVAVIGSEVAFTEAGVHVGSSRAELTKALGPPVVDPDRTRDPRLVVPSALRNARIVLEGDTIAAIVVTAEQARSSRETGRETANDPCARPPTTEKGFGSCLTTAGEVVAVDGDDISVRTADTDRPIASWRASGIVFAGPIRNAADGRDELAIITRTDDSQLRSWSLVAYRIENGRAVRVIEPTVVYQVSSSNARWIGAELTDVELYLELTSRADGIEVGGLLTTRTGQKIRDVVVISPVPVARRRGKSAPTEASDAGVGDAGADIGSGSGRSKP